MRTFGLVLTAKCCLRVEALLGGQTGVQIRVVKSDLSVFPVNIRSNKNDGSETMAGGYLR